MTLRIHVLGASGSGTTTLGAALAGALELSHIDSDDLYWVPTDPPFTTRRSAEDRARLLHQQLPASGHWVFSGSAVPWADEIAPLYRLIVFLQIEPAERLARLRRREAQRYGARIEPGGDMAGIYTNFLAWAASYDQGGLAHRSLLLHENWLANQRAPVLRLPSSRPVASLVDAVRHRLSAS
ncbi:hypothetical protein [Acidiphilium sp.]|uniref:hypothetical protein n=1 Tax=Acidiphilium sp. TaxID=527 RepID=UPI003D027853